MTFNVKNPWIKCKFIYQPLHPKRLSFQIAELHTLFKSIGAIGHNPWHILKKWLQSPLIQTNYFKMQLKKKKKLSESLVTVVFHAFIFFPWYYSRLFRLKMCRIREAWNENVLFWKIHTIFNTQTYSNFSYPVSIYNKLYEYVLHKMQFRNFAVHIWRLWLCAKVL